LFQPGAALRRHGPPRRDSDPLLLLQRSCRDSSSVPDGAKIEFMLSKLSLAAPLVLALAAFAPLLGNADQRSQRLDQEFQAAVSLYNSGRYPEAASRLETLVPKLPKSFEVHELLGMVYSAQSEDEKANPHLEKAVHLRPNSAVARTNLAVNLLRMEKIDKAEGEFKKALEIEPGKYDANHDLGELYIRTGKIAAAIPFLERAQQTSSPSYENGYDLSLAYTITGRFADSRRLIHSLLKQRETAELHNLLAGVEEKEGNFVAAANEYQLAAHLDSSESNLFDWGSELLLHRTLDPAIEVFTQAIQRYPASPRLAIGLGIALYSRGNYDDAVKALLQASDLNPSDPRAYLFLSKAYNSSPSQAEEVIRRFRRYAELQPHDSWAYYYYAMSLWKGKRAQDPDLDLHQIESLLTKSLELDPGLAEPHFQLGNLYSDQRNFSEAIPEYERALKLSPDLTDAHYRLGQAYVRTGEKEKAQEQFQVYQRLREQHLTEVDKQRAEIRQFVYSTKDAPSARQ
jgi:tetratricopeptide (TPR) repeat protein